MAHAALSAYLVSQACTRALSTHSLVDSNTAARRTVERLHALSMAADASPDASRCITLSDDEFFLIASHWNVQATVAHPVFNAPTPRRAYA